jgi:hypothetical protein
MCSRTLAHLFMYDECPRIARDVLTAQVLKALRQILPSAVQESQRECRRDEEHDEHDCDDSHEPGLVNDAGALIRVARRNSTRMRSRCRHQVRGIHDQSHLHAMMTTGKEFIKYSWNNLARRRLLTDLEYGPAPTLVYATTRTL